MHFSTRTIILIALGVLFVAYILFQARFVLLGPGISIESHQNGQIVETAAITLSGTAKNAAWLSLNGRQIFTDEKGFWSEKLILSEGVSIMTLRVRDRFGREKTESVSLVRP
jgi:hypothetical protein